LPHFKWPIEPISTFEQQDLEFVASQSESPRIEGEDGKGGEAGEEVGGRASVEGVGRKMPLLRGKSRTKKTRTEAAAAAAT